MDFHGFEGIRRSTGLYRALFSELAIEVVDQVSEGDRVTSRWVLRGTNRGRSVRLDGIAISRLDGGRIVEDWSSFDSLELLRGLGVARSLLAAPRLLGALRDARPRKTRDG